MKIKQLYFLLVLGIISCQSPKSDMKDESNAADSAEKATQFTGAKGEIRLMTLDPGHFHAALVQKYQYDQVDSTVNIYAPEGDDLQEHLKRIERFNSREEAPTNWQSNVHTGQDFFEKMLQEKPGNVMVVSGSNAKKTKYIHETVKAGINVLADKPMIIKPEAFPLLKETYELAEASGVLLYDIMTERYEITTMLQKELSQQPDVFGQLEKGTPDNPAISKESVHHFFKYVAGQPLKRPAWFFDVEQQGEGIVDVSTHLVDLIFWECFPEQGIDYQSDVEVVSTRRWPTRLSPGQFEKVTGLQDYPDYLQKDVVEDSILNVYSNGSFVFTTRGVHGKVSVTWNYQAPEGAKDTHFSMMRGTQANLVIRQDKAQDYKPTLYVEPIAKGEGNNFEEKLQDAIARLNDKYPGLSLKPSADGWEVIIPDKYKVGHEAHFSQVTEKYLQYLVDGKLPEWELQNILAKYYVTTRAYSLSR
ncbi:putative oxidoreductase C-terminal domain-containing protein [Fulvivirgaceae bacterium BMA12]|uniref:Oxidoreductase C-terminal domain-containing protein n=1 Tax=Agaribacillus aureus TaxID=3051825 RepID=A0ABT8L3W2_9BACT|nr:putative oxidoreductase C-terminal domain-containing protein [Fulvivirgaceae bacterium BMA12]